jgi:hydroxyethylthiazole kinase-like uncharacterized protein yjeF
MNILSYSWMKELDRMAIETAGIPSIVLMENAALAAAACFAAEFPCNRFPDCLVLSGKGNNGGDGLAIGRLLLERGYSVRFVILVPPDQLSVDARTNYDLILALDHDIEIVISVAKLKKILAACNSDETFLVDAVFGTGLDKPVKTGFFAESLDAVNCSGIPVAAVDIPSGLGEGFPPEAGIHVRARVTCALHSLKWSHLNPDGNPDCGRIRVLDIGIPNDLENDKEHYIRGGSQGGFRPRSGRRRFNGKAGSRHPCFLRCLEGRGWTLYRSRPAAQSRPLCPGPSRNHDPLIRKTRTTLREIE